MGLPVEINPLFVSSTGGYTVGRSLRFRSSASAYLNRTPASATNQTTWTWSGWVKLGSIATGSNQTIFGAGNGGVGNYLQIYFDGTSQALSVTAQNSSSTVLNKISTAVYRDPSAWYHVLVAYDSTQATSTNRIKIYVNGVQITSFSTNTDPAQNTTTLINSTNQHTLSSLNYSSRINYFDGYLAEVNFIDGQQLTPSSFGAYDTNGVWQPAKYTGTYGTNGFYLPFSNTTSTSTLVADASGNGNNWTPNNISLTAGTTYDSMIDSPTVGAGASNYAVMNPNFVTPSTTFSNGNLTLTKTGNTDIVATSTIAMPSGKWYWEYTISSLSSSGNLAIGIVKNTTTNGSWVTNLPAGVYFNSGNGVWRYGSNVTGTLGTTFATNDILGFALDMDAGTFALYKNNTLIYTVSSVDTTTPHYAFWDSYLNGESTSFNFGQRPFTYTPPTGFNALNTYNLPAATIKNGAQYMAATLYTGTGAAFTLTNGGNTTIGTTFQPDFVWQKSRSAIANHFLADSVRGVNKELLSDSTIAEATSVQYVTSFNSNGFSFGTDTGINTNAATYVAWQWKAGGTAVTNTSGSITSTVSANTTAGFSVVTFTSTTGTGSVGHGLGVAPSFAILKNRSTTGNWGCYHISLGNNQYINLNSTSAAATSAGSWATSSTTISIDQTNLIGGSGITCVLYCFSAVRGYSAFGSYTGNGSSDGPFVFTNFRPRYLLIKRTDAASDWRVTDSSRSTYNAQVAELFPSSSAAETSTSTEYDADYLSNGFKLRSTNINSNASGGTYIYMAFAENPFNSSRAR